VIFVAHDLRLVRHISHRVAVMYLGQVMEISTSEALFTAPRHPYSKALLDAAPELDPTRRNRTVATRGELPSPLNLPPGCPFAGRCPYAFERCLVERPVLTPRGAGQRAACHLTDFGVLAASA
jgi:oligopeptide/dipeptide ABC transporter ATP-binding protein